jgi:hypothetical protein
MITAVPEPRPREDDMDVPLRGARLPQAEERLDHGPDIHRLEAGA